MTRTLCKAKKDSGERCKARPLSGSRYCFFHDPARARERRAAQKRGGKRHKLAVLPSETADFPTETANDVVNLLGRTINQVRRGEIDPRIANAVGYLSGIILKAREQGDIEERLAKIEKVVLKGDQNGARVA